MITFEQAIDFVEWQIKYREIKERDGMLFLDEYFQNLFQEYRSFIYRQEIPQLVQKFFPS
jgi:hypothetical protein